MKKIILTIATAALFSVSVFAAMVVKRQLKLLLIFHTLYNESLMLIFPVRKM